MFNICGELIFNVLCLFPLFNQTDNNTEDTLSEVVVNVVEYFLIQQFMIL